ncbi:MAG: hypothetical protein V1663_00405 [archaeon]
MAKEKAPKLEEMLSQVAYITDLTKALDKAKTPGQLSGIYDEAAMAIGGEEDHESLLKQYTSSRGPAFASLNIKGARNSLAQSVQKEYLASKDKIAEDVVAIINSSLKEAGSDKGKASRILAGYLTDILIDIPEVTQDEADQYEVERIHSTGTPYAFDVKGSIAQYRDIKIRTKASEFLTEVKKGDSVSYAVDYEKISEAMKNVVKGASLYSRAKIIEGALKEVKEAKK